MAEDFDFKLDGFIPEPDNDKHWIYEERLKDRMTALSEGDVDLRPFSSPRHNQRSTSSCVAHAVVKALEIKRIMQLGMDQHVDLSIMAVYYLSREIMWPPQTHVDAGTYISHACDVLRRFGVCPDKDWPWNTSRINESPSWMAMRKAFTRRIDSFYKIRSTDDKRVLECIRCLQAGNPVVFGTTVGWNWSTYRKGQVLKAPESVRGRHATVLVGWENGYFIGENSWGSGFGDNGFYLMDPDVIAYPQSSDFWVIQSGLEDYVG